MLRFVIGLSLIVVSKYAVRSKTIAINFWKHLVYKL